MTSILLAITLATISADRVSCGNACVDAAESQGLCVAAYEECIGDAYEKCLDDCDYIQAETIENELGEDCFTDSCLSEKCQSEGNSFEDCENEMFKQERE